MGLLFYNCLSASEASQHRNISRYLNPPGAGNTPGRLLFKEVRAASPIRLTGEFFRNRCYLSPGHICPL